MKILSVDTSSANCCIAVVEVNNNKFNILAEKNNADEKTHSQKLMPMLASMLQELQIGLASIDLISCCIVPGSFTGIRIGIATCKAFVDSKNILATSVSSLESLAYNVENPGFTISLIDCKNDNVYGGLFYYDGNNYSKVSDFIADNIDTCLSTFMEQINKSNFTNKQITFVGNGSILHRNSIKQTFSNFNILFSGNNIQSAVSLAKCGYYNYTNNQTGDSTVLSPLYLRASQAERALKNQSN